MYHNLIYILSKKIDKKTLYNFSIINSLYFNNSQERINLEKSIKIGWNKLAKNGHIELVKWLHENRMEGCTIWAMEWAAQNGHLDIVKWLHENRREGCTND